MKKIFFLCIALLVCAIGFSQVTDSTAVVTYNFGDSFTEFLTKNLWTLIFTAFFILSEYLGNFGKIKEGSVIAVVLNWIGKFLRNKGEIIQSKKIMKVLLLAIALSGISIAVNAQSPWKGFFKPVDKNMFALKGASTPAWLTRPTVQLTALQLVWNKETEAFDSQPISSLGGGVSYQHYINVNGEPFNNFGVNGLVLLGTDVTKISPASISLAATVNYSVVNAGIGYNFYNKTPFILTGIVLKY